MVLGETTAVENFLRKAKSHHNTSLLLSDFSKNGFCFYHLYDVASVSEIK